MELSLLHNEVLRLARRIEIFSKLDGELRLARQQIDGLQAEQESLRRENGALREECERLQRALQRCYGLDITPDSR